MYIIYLSTKIFNTLKIQTPALKNILNIITIGKLGLVKALYGHVRNARFDKGNQISLRNVIDSLKWIWYILTHAFCC